MNWLKIFVLLLCKTLCTDTVTAQQSFTEGVLVYHISLSAPDGRAHTGSYTFSFKNAGLRKEIQLDNGYRNITIINCVNNEIYSLQTFNGKKYAIQMSMDAAYKRQQRFLNFAISDEKETGRKNVGCNEYKARLTYQDGRGEDIYYSKDWKLINSIAFIRFPDAEFLPLKFSYKKRNGMCMHFNAEKVEPGPVASSVFRIPDEYKMISWEEYKQLSR